MGEKPLHRAAAKNMTTCMTLTIVQPTTILSMTLNATALFEIFLKNTFCNITMKHLYRVHDSPNAVIRARVDVSTVLC